MTKNIKSLAFLLLALVMALAVFVSCTDSEVEGTGSGTGTETETSTEKGTGESEGSNTETETETNTAAESKTYTILFVDYDGTLISEQKLKEGETPVFIGQQPTRAEDDQNTYTFAGWDKELAAVTGDATYTATYTATPKKTSYTITFYDEDGTTVLESLTLEYGAAITAPADPLKASTATNSFDFAGWVLKGTTEVVDVDATVSGNREYVATYTMTELKYTIIFQDDEGNRIGDPIKVTPGQSFTAPAAPEKAEDAQYTYTFSGWTPELVLTPTADATYTAVFTKTVRTYDVVFYAADGETVLYTDEDVAYGEMPVYGGETPVKIELGYWKFVGWNFELEAVNGENVSYQATFNKVYDFKMETVTATDENGNKFLAVSNSNDVIQGNIQKDTQYIFTLSAAGEDYADKVDYTKHENISFTIMFNYAGIELTDLDGNSIATSAKEAPIKLTVTSEGKIYVDDKLVEGAAMKNGVVSFYINRDAVAHAYSYAEFTLVEYDVEIKEKVWAALDTDLASGMSGTTAAGTVDSAAEALGITSVTEYTFTGSFQNAAFANIDLTQYEIVKFYLCRPTVGGGGAVYETADGGNALVYLNGVERLDKWVGIELRKGDSGYDIYVDGAKVTFTLKDGAVLTNLNQLALNGSSGTVKYSNIMVVKFDDVKYYTVTFKNDDGTVLNSEELQEGAIPTAPANPTKTPTNTEQYTFAGWDSEIVAVTGDVTYTATYTASAREYTIKFYQEDGTTEIGTTQTLNWGAQITKPADPTKDATPEYTYSFAGWTLKGSDTVAEVDATVQGNREYVAEFTATKNKYTVTWKNYDGSTLETDENVEYGTMPNYDGATPEKPADNENTYAFTGWSPVESAVTGDVTYTAQFASTSATYTIKFYNEDGTTEIGTTQTLNWGAQITKPADPTKDATPEYTYSFAGWTLKGSDTVVEVDATVKGDREYVAKFTAVSNAVEIELTIGNNGAVAGEGVTAQSITLPSTAVWDLTDDNAKTVTVALTDAEKLADSLTINGVEISGTNQIVINAIPYLVGAADTTVKGQVSFKIAYIQGTLYFGNQVSNDNVNALVHTVALKSDGSEDTKIAMQTANNLTQINNKDVVTTGTGIVYNKFNVEKDSTGAACYDWRLYTTKSAGSISFYIGCNQSITIYAKGDINNSSATSYVLEGNKAHLITILSDGKVLVNGVDTGIVTTKGESAKNSTDTVEGFCLDMKFGGAYAGFHISTAWWRYNIV